MSDRPDVVVETLSDGVVFREEGQPDRYLYLDADSLVDVED